jgi:hypothetical protein
MLFATLVLERDPLQWADLPTGLETWIQDVGGFAAAALVVYALYRWFRPATGSRIPWPGWQRGLFRLALLGIVVGYGLLLVIQAPIFLAWAMGALEGENRTAVPLGSADLPRYGYLIGGISAILAVTLPFFADLTRLRWRRVWALARLSFKEAIRRRVLWAFSGLLLVFLFASWFIPYKPEDQVRNYVKAVYWSMTPLMLFTAALIAAFSIPTDVRTQTIHTIVTKPVERFEIVVGRFLGYAMLMSLVLLAFTGVSLFYVFREIDPDAQFESMRARVPVYGVLHFRSKQAGFEGESVGREWEYRRYIAGSPGSSQRAIWMFKDLPADLANRPEPVVPCEFSFDIFRTVKGEEGKGVFCQFLFLTPKWDPAHEAEYKQERDALRRKPGADLNQVNNELAEKYGIFEIPSKEIVDYHTQSIDIPTGLFKSALAARPQAAPGGDEPYEMQVQVKCESGGQYLGVAKYDFYILAREQSFAWNFFKGALGLWMRLIVIIGVAVALSTYLSGMIAFLTTLFLYGVGVFQEYVKALAQNASVGGGPAESFLRLVRKESLVTPLDPTPDANLAFGTDQVYRWILRRFLDVIPDVDRFDFTDYVAEGFNISMSHTVLVTGLMLLGYLLPWAILGYYLMKSREIAGNT